MLLQNRWGFVDRGRPIVTYNMAQEPDAQPWAAVLRRSAADGPGNDPAGYAGDPVPLCLGAEVIDRLRSRRIID